MPGALPSRTRASDNAGVLPAGWPTFAHDVRGRLPDGLARKMHFIGPDQLHGFEERLTTDVYPAGLDWIPDRDLPDGARLPWYHDMSSVHRAGPVRSTLHPTPDDGAARCIATGRDFWTTLERARLTLPEE